LWLQGRNDSVTRRLAHYSAATGIVGTGLMAAAAAFPGWMLLMHLPAAVRGDLRICLLSFVSAPAAVAMRRFLHGRLIVAHRTRPIALVSWVRVMVTGAPAMATTLAVGPAPAAGDDGVVEHEPRAPGGDRYVALRADRPSTTYEGGTTNGHEEGSGSDTQATVTPRWLLRHW
jgi:hypothetical protein